MSISLATTWFPRGEYPGFTRLLPMLEEKYAFIVIALIPGTDQVVLEQLTSREFLSKSKVIIYVNDDPRKGRFMAI
jgi:hypothetical protein